MINHGLYEVKLYKLMSNRSINNTDCNYDLIITMIFLWDMWANQNQVNNNFSASTIQNSLWLVEIIIGGS